MKLNSEGRLTKEQLQMVGYALDASAALYNYYLRYYQGNNPEINDAAAKAKPDNRIPVPFGRKIVNTLKGYMFKPGSLGFSTSSSNSPFLEYLLDAFERSEMNLQLAELATDAMNNGIGYQVLRTNPTATEIDFYRVLPGTGMFVYDDTLARGILAFVHIVTEDIDSTGYNKMYTRTVYYADKYVVEERQSGAAEWVYVEEKEHPFLEVPAVPYTVNMDAMPTIKPVLPIVDEHDKIISSGYADELERFAQAYLLMLDELDAITKDENGLTELDKINQVRAFMGLARSGNTANVNDAVSFLTKPSRANDMAEAADRFERLVYDLSMILNPNDKDFGTSSGIALRLKMVPMEFQAADIETYFAKGLKRMFRLVGNAKEIHGIEPESIKITWTRNLPFDLENLAKIAGLLKGILSDETILKQFPSSVVDSVKEELKRLEGQAPKLPNPLDTPDISVVSSKVGMEDINKDIA